MLLYPSINELTKKADSKYTLAMRKESERYHRQQACADRACSGAPCEHGYI